MITYKFTNAAGVDVEVLTDGQGDATNELRRDKRNRRIRR